MSHFEPFIGQWVIDHTATRWSIRDWYQRNATFVIQMDKLNASLRCCQFQLDKSDAVSSVIPIGGHENDQLVENFGAIYNHAWKYHSQIQSFRNRNDTTFVFITHLYPDSSFFWFSNRIPTVKLKFRKKHFWNPNPELLFHSSYSSQFLHSSVLAKSKLLPLVDS